MLLVRKRANEAFSANRACPRLAIVFIDVCLISSAEGASQVKTPACEGSSAALPRSQTHSSPRVSLHFSRENWES